jgi:hypothetical protein
MKPSLKQYADYFCMGLELEVCSHAEIISWADDLIGESDKPEDWLIELATSHNQHILDVLHILRNIPGLAELNISFQLLMARLGKQVPTILPKDTKLLNRLYSLVYSEISSDFKVHLYSIDYALDFLEFKGDWSFIQQEYEKLLAIGADFKDWVN